MLEAASVKANNSLARLVVPAHFKERRRQHDRVFVPVVPPQPLAILVLLPVVLAAERDRVLVVGLDADPGLRF